MVRTRAPVATLVLARWARAVASAALLLAVLLGVPAALLLWGDWPITGLPTAQQVRDLPGTVASDSALIAVFTVALWCGWALFALCVMVEATAEIRGRRPRRVMAAGPLQVLARHLVTTVAVTLGSLGPVAAGTAPAAAARPPADATAVQAPAAGAAASAAGSDARAPGPDAPGPRPASRPGARSASRPVAGGPDAPGASDPGDAGPATVTVAVGDNPWRLAEEHLGAGARWVEIWEANRGRPQPDGRAWDEPGLLLPGWRLRLPEGPAVPVPPAGAGRIVVQPDDNPWSLAARHLGEGTRWRELYALNRGRPQPGGGTWVVESHIEPGWVLDLPAPEPAAGGDTARPRTAQVEPAPPAPPPTTPPPTTPPAAPRPAGPAVTGGGVNGGDGAAGGGPGGGDAADGEVGTGPGDGEVGTGPGDGEVGSGLGDGDLDIVPVAVVAASALLAAGVVKRLDLARLRRGRRRARGAPGVPPVVGAEASERRWRAIADHESAAWVGTAVRYLTWAVREAGTTVDVVGARVGPSGLAFLLAAPAPHGAPRFAAQRSGWEWALDCDDLDVLATIAAGEAPYAPALVTLGTAEDGSTVLVDLERLGLISLEGDRGVIRAWSTAVALDVATAPWAGEVDLCLVGGLTALGGLERVSVLDPEDVRATVDRAVVATAGALGERPTTQAARADCPAEPWPPVAVVVSAAGSDASLVDAARPGRGAGVVAVGPVRGATYRLSAGADGFATLFPYGLSVRLSAVDARTAADTARLLAGAEAVPSPAGPAGPVALGAPAAAALAAPVVGGTPAEVRAKYDALTRSILEPAEIEVTVLGRPRVSGWASEPRQRSVEIVCYLAVHDGPVTGERLRDRIFPPGFKATSLRQAVSRTRGALGRSADGRPHILPAAKDGSYELGPGVRSDVQRFEALVAAARHAPEACEIPLLRTALALVQGPPFSDCPPGGYGWASSEGISYALERMVVDAAHRLNELAFAVGDAHLAEWASRQGQRALPGHEGLYCDLALAKLRQDDLDGFTAVRREAEASAAALDALDGLQPETHEFFSRALAQYRDARDAREAGAVPEPGDVRDPRDVRDAADGG